MKKSFLILTILLLSVLSLSGGGKTESEPPALDPGTASGEGRTISTSYKIEKSQAGTRSEGLSHILIINRLIIPDVFELVYGGNALYRFTVRNQAWGDCGYVKVKEGEVPFGVTSIGISKRDWELGWYEGSRQKAGTPRSWVYVERDDLSAFVSPDELERFITYKNLEVMKRDLSAPVKK